MATDNLQPAWPARAVVTAGMPYGNKPLHFGHIAGVFVPADAFARFLRDRIGADNVRFISGTDCFGSPINEGYRKLREEAGFDGTIADYVERNHEAQKRTLEAYDISLSIYQGSGIGHAGEVHQAFTDRFIRSLYEAGHLRRRSTLQFYDPQAQTFLNGRQVTGRCPVQGCKSEKAYADECDLGPRTSSRRSRRSPDACPRCARWRTGTSTCPPSATTCAPTQPSSAPMPTCARSCPRP